MTLYAFEAPNSPRISQSYGKDGTKTEGIREFIVDAGDKMVGPFAVLNAVGLPRPRQTFNFGDEEHKLAKVVNRTPDRIEPGSEVWIVEVEYSSEENGEETWENPLDEIPIIKLGGENVQQRVMGVINNEDFGEGIRNSAGELINPPLTRDVNRPVLSITRNEDINTPIEAITNEFANSTNLDVFWGAAAGYARMLAPESERMVSEINDTGDKFVYLKNTYKIAFSTDPGGWLHTQLDHGSYYLNAAGQKITFRTDSGEPYIGLLNGINGQASATAEFLEPKKIYREKVFATLNLPQSFRDIY